MQKIRYYFELSKFRLSLTVVFSALAGYFLGLEGSERISFDLSLLIIGGFFVTASANAFNQILERNYDRLMKRTQDRPLASGKLEIIPAILFALLIGISGLWMLYKINPYCCYFGALSIFLYVACYTPLKRISSFSILVGAIPGAIPFLLGWVATYDFELISSEFNTGFEMASGILFAIQFFWQFPHFIAISWVQDNDYKKAGFRMMIGKEKGNISAFTSIVSTLCLIGFSISPFLFDIPKLSLSGVTFVLVISLGIFFLFQSIQLFLKQDDYSAKKLMFTSFIYLPLLQILMIADKYLPQIINIYL